MLTARREQGLSAFARRLDYQLFDGGRSVGRMSYEREEGAVETDGRRFTIESVAKPTLLDWCVRQLIGLWKDEFVLKDDAGVAIARADKSAGRAFTLRCGTQVFDIRHRRTVSLARVLEVRAEPGGALVGEVDYGIVGGREITASLPPPLPLAVRGFIFWMAVYCLRTNPHQG